MTEIFLMATSLISKDIFLMTNVEGEQIYTLQKTNLFSYFFKNR